MWLGIDLLKIIYFLKIVNQEYQKKKKLQLKGSFNFKNNPWTLTRAPLKKKLS
jgi:hypothetical protein